MKLNLKTPGMEIDYEGDQEFLESKVNQLVEGFTHLQNEKVKRDLYSINSDLEQDLSQLVAHFTRIIQLNEELSVKIKDFFEKLYVLSKQMTANSAGQIDQFDLDHLVEMNESFNLQYLVLQQQMQDESRRFSLLSNIMKTKHDTAKNSISNLR